MRSWKIRLLTSAVCLGQLIGAEAQAAAQALEPAVIPADDLQTATGTNLLTANPESNEPNAVPVEAVANPAETPLPQILPMIAETTQVLTPTPNPEPTIKPPPAAKPKKKVPPQFPGAKTLPPTGPYKTLFFDNDYSYKKDPNHQVLFGEDWKNVPFTVFDQEFKFSTGGEIRHRYMNEDNRLRPGGPIQSDNDLLRWRHFFDLQAGDMFRFYVESIFADSYGGEAPVQQIDVNRWDLQNFFTDINLYEGDLGKHTLRYGRQELLFGRQRLVSPLDWANTRRNFQGYRYMLKGDDYKFDFFAVNPVNSATGFAPVSQYDNEFDQAHHGINFMGSYFSYTGVQNTTLEAYWMYQNTTKDVVSKPDGSRHTMGSHIARLFPITDLCGEESRVWDFDTEGAFQFGEDNKQSVLAGFYTAIAGHTWKQVPWTPRISGLFYYGSGDNNPKDNRNNTFSVMYPLGHAYWGLADNLVGQNLINYSVQADVKPTKKTAITAAYHWFELASNGDKAYNVAGLPVGTPGNGRNLGQELDLYGYYAFSPNFDIQAGSSWFWYGSYIDRTAPRGDALQLYVQTSFRY